MTTPASPRQVLLDLADRCEREEPSRQLDREIAAALGYGVQVIEIDDEHPMADVFKVGGGLEFMILPDGRRTGIPPYTTSLDAAVTLLAEGCEWELTNLYGIAVASVGLNRANGNWQSGAHKGGHLALALCAASLRARAEAL